MSTHSLLVDRSPLISAPDTVAKLIVAALDGTHKSAFASVSKERG